jgi:hypothetical protein
MARKTILALVALLVGGSLLVGPAALAASVTSTVPVGPFPGILAVSPDGRSAWVPNSGGGIIKTSVIGQNQ